MALGNGSSCAKETSCPPSIQAQQSLSKQSPLNAPRPWKVIDMCCLCDDQQSAASQGSSRPPAPDHPSTRPMDPFQEAWRRAVVTPPSTDEEEESPAHSSASGWGAVAVHQPEALAAAHPDLPAEPIFDLGEGPAPKKKQRQAQKNLSSSHLATASHFQSGRSCNARA